MTDPAEAAPPQLARYRFEEIDRIDDGAERVLLYHRAERRPKIRGAHCRPRPA